MSRPRNQVPTYRLHKQSGQAIVTVAHNGTRKDVLLGKFGSPESKAEYERVLAEIRTPAGVVGFIQAAGKTDLTIAELLLAYLEHAEKHYCGSDSTPTDEVRHLKTACRVVRELYGTVPAPEFGPLALKAVRERFIAAGWSRKTVNARIERVRRVFRWAVAEELVPPAVYQALTAVKGLQRGRTSARETEPILPVDDATVDATLAHLNRHVRGLVEFQRFTGCRPTEACRVRRSDIDMSGAVWLYRPTKHKGSWKGKPRTIAIGPKAQTLLREFFTPDIEEYLFSPRRAIEEMKANRAANRKTPCYPSHMKYNAARRKANPKWTAKERYNRLSYGTAVDRACDKAFPPPPPLAKRPGESVAKWWQRLAAEQRDEVKTWQKAHRWSPNRIRHSVATRVRKDHGLEAAQALLGHNKASTTEIYAERNDSLAASVAAKIG
jgi:integrase